MNKKMVVIAVALLAITMLVTPVLAAPTQGQKVPITLKFTPLADSGNSPGDFWITGGSIKQVRNAATAYTVELSIDGAAPIVGISIAERPIIVYNIIKHQFFTIHEIHVMDFPTEEGGFEGNALLQFTDFVSISSYQIKAHGTFHGTGAFEGQTIVAGYDGPQGGTWAGYLLKPLN